MCWTPSPTGLAGGQYKSVLGDRVVEQAAGIIQTISFRSTTRSSTTPNCRKAISMAIDRQQIIDNVFNGTREPATGWVPGRERVQGRGLR